MRKNKGFAMGLFLLTLLVLGSISASMIFITSQDSMSSNSVNSKNDARATANIVSEYISSQLRIDNNYLFNISISTDAASTCSKTKSNALVILNCDGLFTNFGEVNTTSNTFFTNALCNDPIKKLYTNCVSIFVKPIGGNGVISSSIGTSRVNAAKLFIKVRSGCRGNLARCRYTTYQETFRIKNFFDYMYYLKYTTLDPRLYTANIINGLVSSGVSNITNTTDAESLCGNKEVTSRNSNCINVNFTTNDTFDTASQFYTEDNYYFLCGDVNLNTLQILSPRGGSTAATYSSDPSCTPAAPKLFPLTSRTSTIGNLPITPTAEGAKILVQQPAGNVVTTPGGICTYKSNNSSTFKYSVGVTYVNGTPVPALTGCERIIFFANIGSGTLTIEDSDYTGAQISIISTGGVTLDGNLDYNKGLKPKSLMSITATGDIIISAPTAICTSCNKIIKAFLFSQDRTIKVDNWDGAIDPTYDARNISPILNFTGSIVGKYQPVFGSFNVSTSPPSLYSGYKKNFVFDDRVKNGDIFIPYVISPKDPQWDKFELVEIASKA